MPGEDYAICSSCGWGHPDDVQEGRCTGLESCERRGEYVKMYSLIQQAWPLIEHGRGCKADKKAWKKGALAWMAKHEAWIGGRGTFVRPQD